ncbi:hypothetical protein GCM10010182_58300 [Actinomadura cremea]|nr:hypothetical protein GCM10010182_58300 [Actinomadura cremea]
MTHRSRTLAVGAALALAATTVVVQAPAAHAAALDKADFQLRVDPENSAYLKGNVAELDGELPGAGVASIMTDANRQGVVRSGAACDSGAVTDPDRADDKPGVSVVQSICWQDDATGEDDRNTEQWYPQGITTVADAQADQWWGEDNQPILATWYHKADSTGNSQKGVRVSFIDPGTGKYRHVLLVHPYENGSGNASYTSVRDDQTGGEGTSLHAGGIVWYGNFLYVADTNRGFRVFDMRHIYDLKAAGDKGNVTDQGKVGRHDGVFYGYGYRYVMPEVTQWRRVTAQGGTCTDSAKGGKFSHASLDRSGVDHILAGEYCNGQYGRVAAWKIADATDGSEQRESGTWNADAVHRLPETNIQGATRFDGRWYLSQSHGAPEPGEDDEGELHTTEKTSSDTGGLVTARTQPAAIGVEDLSHWPTGGGTEQGLGVIWSLSEHENERMVYATRPQ